MTCVLIVDDKDENLYYLRSLLAAHGCEVIEARHGAEALVLARANPPDLAVSDLLMPVMDGYTLLRHWKADARLKRVPFVVYTATYTEADDERLALSLGADAFILKPAEPDAFLARLRAVQDGRASSPPVTPREPEGDENALLKEYSVTLIRKLEEKTMQLEEANRALVQDIDERKRDKIQLEQSAALLRIAGRAARLGGWAYRVADETLVWSDEVCVIHDLPAGHAPTLDEALGYYAPESRPQIAQLVGACLREGTSFDSEAQIVTSAGRRVWVRTVGEAARDGSGAVISIQGAVQDISDRKLLEQQFLRAQRMESLGTLAGGIAHDLNNVLSPIMLSVDLLKQFVQDPEGLHILGMIGASARRGADMVSQVLSFARGMEGRRVAFDLRQCVRDIIRLAEETFPKDIRVVGRLDESVGMLDADPTQVHQVLLNLCVNSRDAMPNGGEITISTCSEVLGPEDIADVPEASLGPHVILEVEDTGEGIAPQHIDRIFEPFFTTKDVGKGTGLGLATTLAIVKGHGGFIRVHSVPGRGTRFRIHLPARRDPSAGEDVSVASGLQRGDGETILVVDDEASIRQIARQTLEAFGYRVLVAADGAEAVSLYLRHQRDIALVFTDLMMPVMDGPATIQALRRSRPDVRVIGTSGVNSGALLAEATHAGMVCFLPKPYTASMLLGAIRQALVADDGA